MAKLLLCLFLWGISACSQQESSSPTPASSSDSPSTISHKTSQPPARSAPLDMSDDQSETECTRGEPEPLLRTVPGQPDPKFQKTGKDEAIETFQMQDRRTLTIRQFGCTHYALEFTLTSADTNPPSLTDWLHQFVKILREIPIHESHASLMSTLADFLTQQIGSSVESGIPLSMSETETISITAEGHPQHLILLYEVAL